jgi:FkbM family methyltransferase
MVKIAIVDLIGLTYDPTTLEKYGLGGSESAVIYMARELQKKGFEVTVFNNCIDSRAQEGVYDGVRYVDNQRLHQPNDYTCDVLIVSRTVIPFLPERYWKDVNYNPGVYQQLKNSAKKKILWLHDTFCSGDNLLEELVMDGHIDEVFTLSDFHTTYFANSNHGRRRNFEVLKNKIFMTRNGIKRHIKEVDVTKKDPNLFVYNASITKGMLPLVENIWPQVKRRIPTAKLKVIGGYYRFRDGAPPDAQEETWHKLIARPEMKAMDIEFTGVIPQNQIAEILAESSFMIFPGAFPETFGISSLESLAYNTPLITTRFGALEETAVDMACYKIDYAIEPNNLFTDINKDAQVQKFVNVVVAAYNNPYLHAQKMQYCNIVHDICEWDTVALQWKQHLYKILGLYLPVDEYKKVSYVNQKVHEVYTRRYSNPEEWQPVRSYPQQHLSIVSPFYNAKDYIADCILSVASQDYENYTHHLIDDASTDGSFEIAKNTINSLPESIRSRFKLIRNGVNQGAVANQVLTIVSCSDEDIILMLDGDDKLVNDNNIFQYYNSIYDGTTEFTYGSMWSMVDNIPLIAQPYPEHIKQNREYRKHLFAWNMPYTHLRTFKKYLFNDIEMSAFQNEHGKWFRAGGDTAIFYNTIEKAEPSKVKALQKIVYNYNDKNPLNDYKVHGVEQTNTANKVLNNVIKTSTINTMPTQMKKKILLAIPTAKYIESETFKSIFDLDVPDDVELTFQYFYGYNIDQIRNLIAHWAIHYDYLFSVDSDIVLPKDCLTKMLQHDKDMVSGVYIQRKADQEILEIYRKNEHGGVSNVPFIFLQPAGLHPIDGCGFGCVLVKSEVIRRIGYPQFVYKSALNHINTISEDVYFCTKARELGFQIFVDSTIVCNHIGNTVFVPKDIMSEEQQKNYLRYLSTLDFRKEDTDYLKTLKKTGVSPKVIYDIGACTGNWTREARKVWDNSKFVLFEAMPQVEFLLKETGFDYHIGVLSDASHKEVEFFENVWQPGGNSYYREIGHPESGRVFSDAHMVKKTTRSLDDVVRYNNFPLPELMKIDVQGCEVDVLKGAEYTLSKCTDLLIELQHTEYNQGAPLKDEAIQFLNSIGFKQKHAMTPAPFDGDYHFVRVK